MRVRRNKGIPSWYSMVLICPPLLWVAIKLGSLFGWSQAMWRPDHYVAAGLKYFYTTFLNNFHALLMKAWQNVVQQRFRTLMIKSQAKQQCEVQTTTSQMLQLEILQPNFRTSLMKAWQTVVKSKYHYKSTGPYLIKIRFVFSYRNIEES